MSMQGRHKTGQALMHAISGPRCDLYTGSAGFPDLQFLQIQQ